MKWLKRWLPERPIIPPCPTTFGREYLEWQCRYAPRIVAACAAKTLADMAERDEYEALLRKIIREELAGVK